MDTEVLDLFLVGEFEGLGQYWPRSAIGWLGRFDVCGVWRNCEIQSSSFFCFRYSLSIAGKPTLSEDFIL